MILKNLSRQIIQEEKSKLQKLWNKNEEDFKTNIYALNEVFDKMIDQTTPSSLSEFTNYVNVFRMQQADSMIKTSSKQKLNRRIQALFTEE